MTFQNSAPQKVRVRFAPAPTGYLHIGGLRTALFNWLFARHYQGTFLLRIEDTDRERYTPEHEQALVQGLAWAGIASDEAVVIQSTRAGRHKELVEQLLNEDKAYRCYCSYDELQEKRSAHTESFKEGFMYDGACRDKEFPEHYKFQKKHVIRLKVDRNVHEISFVDIIRDYVNVQMDTIDDFILMRSNGGFMYNFVVVVDDHDMGITHVVRGEEHLLNTPKQLLLYQALGFKAPEFAHLPLILSPEGGKLSKRDGAVSVTEYAKEGFLPAALCNYLVRLGWAYKDQEIFTVQEMIQYFSLSGVNKKGAIFDRQKLLWVNSMYLKSSTNQELFDRIIKDMQFPLQKRFELWNQETLLQAISFYKERVSTLKELCEEMYLAYQAPVNYDQASLDKWVDAHTADIVSLFMDKMMHTDSIKEAYSELAKVVCKEKNCKLPQLAQPLRIALFGESSGPGIFEIMQLLGKQEVFTRVQKFVHFVKKGS